MMSISFYKVDYISMLCRFRTCYISAFFKISYVINYPVYLCL